MRYIICAVRFLCSSTQPRIKGKYCHWIRKLCLTLQKIILSLIVCRRWCRKWRRKASRDHVDIHLFFEHIYDEQNENDTRRLLLQVGCHDDRKIMWQRLGEQIKCLKNTTRRLNLCDVIRWCTIASYSPRTMKFCESKKQIGCLYKPFICFMYKIPYIDRYFNSLKNVVLENSIRWNNNFCFALR